MYLGLPRIIALFLCYLLYANASNFREQDTNDANNLQKAVNSTNSQRSRNSKISDALKSVDEASGKAVLLKNFLRKRRDMKSSTGSIELSNLSGLRTISKRPSRLSTRSVDGKNLDWDNNTGVPRTTKSRNNRVFGRLGNKRICTEQHGMIFCQRVRNAGSDKARNLKDTEFSRKLTDNILVKNIYDFEVEQLRNKLESMRQQNIEDLLKGDDNHQLVGGSLVKDVVAHQLVAHQGGEEHKRNDVASLVEGEDPQESRVRPRFYPNDGPKRDWKVNLMRVWG